MGENKETATPIPHNADVILLHENMMENTEKAVHRLEKEIYGIPQRLDSLEKSVTELCKNLSDFLQKIEDKYVTKEMSELCDKQLAEQILNMKKDYDEKIKSLEDENEKLGKKFDKVLWGLIAVILTVIGYLGATGIGLIIHSLQK